MMLLAVESSIREILFDDLSELFEPASWIRMGVRLLVAALFGAVLGWQREQIGKAAGLRTHMLVAVGAALFIGVSQHMGMQHEPLTRVIQGILVGVGFIGGGAILKLSDRGEIVGLTTATSVWLAAGIGVAAGLGKPMSAFLGAALGLFILSGFFGLEQKHFPRCARHHENVEPR